MTAVNLTLRDSDARPFTLRQIALGFKPIIVIEPEFEGEGDDEVMSLSVDATDLDRNDLAGLLEYVADVLREGAEVPE